MISNIGITSHSNTYFKSKKAETTNIGDNATVLYAGYLVFKNEITSFILFNRL